jgi:hypothetical protein
VAGEASLNKNRCNPLVEKLGGIFGKGDARGNKPDNNWLHLPFRADAELVSGLNNFAVGDGDIQHFLALHLTTGFVFEGSNDLPGFRVNDFTSRRIRGAAVRAEADPARRVAEFYTRNLLRRHRGRIEDVRKIVGAVYHPEFFLILGESDAMARTPVPLYRALLDSLNLDAMQHLAGPDVPDLKSEQPVHVDEAQRIMNLGADSEQLIVSLYGTGIRFRSDLAGVQVRVGGQPADVLYAGAQGQFIGLDQVNLRLPRALQGRGAVTLVLSVAGVTANPVTLNVQ